MTYSCFASCAFGLEALTANELKRLGFTDISVRDARVYFLADAQGIARANLWLRTADRVYMELADFEAASFEELFEGVRGIAWEAHIARDAAFPVNADSVASGLFSVSDIQSVGKKAVVTRLMERHNVRVLPETGAKHDIHLKVLRNRVSACINTSGAGLNRRGYRLANVAAPLRETLAAGLVMLTGWQDGGFADPMCGSGTIAIEAAMIGASMAPGLLRDFDAQKWRGFSKAFEAERVMARSERSKPQPVFASDNDNRALSAAAKNIKAAGVEIKLYHADVKSFSRQNAVVLTNPPYAVRLGEKDGVHRLYKDMGQAFEGVGKKFIITADAEFERWFGKRASKKRKLYNGNLRCTLYQYL